MRVYRSRRARSLTDYKRRIALLKGGMNRLVVRKTNRCVIMQIVEYREDGDVILKSVNSKELVKYGWSPRRNIPTAYLTGVLLSKRAPNKDAELVLDTGLYKPVKNSLIFAAAKGCIDSGMKLRGSIEFDESRLSGSHISGFAAKVKESPERYKNQFSKYKEDGLSTMAKRFAEAREMIARDG